MEKKIFNTKKSTRKGSVVGAFKRKNGKFGKSSKPFDRSSRSSSDSSRTYGKSSRSNDSSSRPFRRDSKPYDRSNRNSEGEGRPFRRDSKPFNRDSKPFRRDYKPFDRSSNGESRPFRRDSKPFKKEARPFNRDSKPYDRAARTSDRNFKTYDRPYKSNNRDAKPFNRDSAKPFNRDAKPFRRDSKPYDRSNRSSEGDSRPFKRDAKPFNRDAKPFNRDSKPFNRDKQPYKGRSNSSRGGNFGGFKRGGGRSKGKMKSLDITSFIQKAQIEAKENKVFEIVNTFEDFAFDENVKKNLKRMGFVTPTPIQDGTIVHILAGEDVIGLANTGTGKTGAFLLPLITKTLKDPSQKVLIIAPTRELVLQIDNEFRAFAQGTKLKSATVIGGVSVPKQIHNLLRKPSFVFGTPGRLKDLSERKALKFKEYNNIVLDEVDRMLDMGFLPEVRNIVSQIREKRQSLFFSATMPDEIKKLTNEFLNDPVVVERQAGRTVANTQQEIVNISDSTAKFNELKRILEEDPKAMVMVFSETKRSVEKLTEMLSKIGIKVDSIHGDKSQYQRQRALAKFKEGKANVLIATDVAARGLDIKGVNIVVNYTVPQTYDDYVHRIGRTGRANAKGRAITFVS